MKNKATVCPRCGGKLFLTGRFGEKTCATCGQLLNGDSARPSSLEPAPSPSPSLSATEICPSCGSPAEFSHNDPNGEPVYSCSFCGTRFSPKKKESARGAYEQPIDVREAIRGELEAHRKEIDNELQQQRRKLDQEMEAKRKQLDEEVARRMEEATKNAAPTERASGSFDGKRVFAIARECSVEVHSTFQGKAYGSAGSGFFFTEDGYILTNCHVVAENFNTPRIRYADSIQVNRKGERRYTAKLIYAEPNEDMAILKASIPNKGVARFANSVPETGEAIFAVGNSAGAGMCILEGIVADASRRVSNNIYMMISANIVGGNSGGPIFNTRGEVVGIVTLGSDTAVAMNYGITLGRAKNFLARAEEETDLRFGFR